VLELPPAVLGPMDDAWFRWVTDVGITGRTRVKAENTVAATRLYGRGARWLLCCAFPHGRKSALLRTFLKDGDPKPGVDRVKEACECIPQSGFQPPPMKFVNISGQGVQHNRPRDYSLFEFANSVIQNEPGTSLDPDTLGLFAAAGIEKGKSFNPDLA